MFSIIKLIISAVFFGAVLAMAAVIMYQSNKIKNLTTDNKILETNASVLEKEIESREAANAAGRDYKKEAEKRINELKEALENAKYKDQVTKDCINNVPLPKSIIDRLPK